MSCELTCDVKRLEYIRMAKYVVLVSVLFDVGLGRCTQRNEYKIDLAKTMVSSEQYT